MSQTTDLIVSLRTSLIRIVREATGLHERLALPVADAIIRELQSEFGGSAIRIPARSKDDRYQEIKAALDVGCSPAEIQSRLGVSRATVYRAMSSQ